MTESSGLKRFQTLSMRWQEVRMLLKKLDVLTAHLRAPSYKLIQEEATYERAIETLQKLFVKPRNEIPGIF